MTPDGRKRKCGLELAPGGCFLGASSCQLYQRWTVTQRIGTHSGTLPFTGEPPAAPPSRPLPSLPCLFAGLSLPRRSQRRPPPPSPRVLTSAPPAASSNVCHFTHGCLGAAIWSFLCSNRGKLRIHPNIEVCRPPEGCSDHVEGGRPRRPPVPVSFRKLLLKSDHRGSQRRAGSPQRAG